MKINCNSGKLLLGLLTLVSLYYGHLNAASPQSEPVKIPLKLFEIPDVKDMNPFRQADLAVFRTFTKKYPDIKPEAFSGIAIDGMGMDSAPLLAIAGGNSPDVLYINFRQSDTYINQGFLYPLDDFINRDMTKPELDLRVPEAAWPVLKREGPAIGKFAAGIHTWVLPYRAEVRTLCYRKDIFEEVGLDPEKPPRNWQELYEYAKRISDPSHGRYGMFVCGGPQEAWEWIAFLWSAGGEAVVKNKYGDWKAVFNTPAALTALEFYLKLTMERWTDADGNRQVGYVLRQGGDANAWEEGRVGMRMMYLDDKSIGNGIDPALYGIAPFPVGPTGLRSTEINCSMMGIFSDIKGRRNADGIFVPADKIREAAWKYIRFYDSEEARKIRMDKLVELGYGKMLNPIWLRRYGYEDYAKYVPPGWEKVYIEAMKNGRPEPYGKNCQKVYEFMTDPIEYASQRIRSDKNFMNSPVYQKELQKLLNTAVEKTNRIMLGKVTPAEKARRNLISGIVAIIVLAVFSAVFYKVWKLFSPPKKSSKGWGFRKYTFAYIIMLPAIASIILWFYAPMLMGSRMAVMDYHFVGDSPWVGLDNISAVLFSIDWWQSLWNTFRYMLLMLVLGFWPPILLAILLQEVSHGKIAYRVIYYLPAVMSGIVVLYLWKLFFEPDRSGILNQLVIGVMSVFGKSGMEPVAWLFDPNLAMLCCVIPTIWAGTGPGCLIYLAALKGIPPDLYEAADLDGCNFIQKIRYISLPSIKALIVIQFIGAFIAATQSTQMILVMTYGRADTEVAGLHIFKEAYMSLRFGTAICMAWMLGVTLLLFTTYQLKMLSKVEFKANAGENK